MAVAAHDTLLATASIRLSHGEEEGFRASLADCGAETTQPILANSRGVGSDNVR